MLIVMKDRDAHAFAQRTFDDEAFGRLDVFEVDAPERRLKRRNDLDELVGIPLVHLDVEDIDAGELLEQHPLAFHDRLRRKRTDGTQSEHRRAVGDHPNEVSPRRQVACLGGIRLDRFTGERDPRTVGQRKIALVDQALGWRHRDLPRDRIAMVVECCLFQSIVVVHDSAEIDMSSPVARRVRVTRNTIVNMV
jgi:hypothetical protein